MIALHGKPLASCDVAAHCEPGKLVVECNGDIGVSGGACLASSLAVAAQASVSINVSVQASANVQGEASS